MKMTSQCLEEGEVKGGSREAGGEGKEREGEKSNSADGCDADIY